MTQESCQQGRWEVRPNQGLLKPLQAVSLRHLLHIVNSTSLKQTPGLSLKWTGSWSSTTRPRGKLTVSQTFPVLHCQQSSCAAIAMQAMVMRLNHEDVALPFAETHMHWAHSLLDCAFEMHGIAAQLHSSHHCCTVCHHDAMPSYQALCPGADQQLAAAVTSCPLRRMWAVSLAKLSRSLWPPWRGTKLLFGD